VEKECGGTLMKMATKLYCVGKDGQSKAPLCTTFALLPLRVKAAILGKGGKSA